MRNIFIVLTILILATPAAWSQPKKPATQPKPTAPAGPRIPPPQYVTKKDFEAKIADLESRARAAQNAGASARGLVVSIQDSLTAVGSKVTDIENLLNSANFQIAMNFDSLKSTRTQIEELRMDHEKRLTELQAKNDSLMMYVYILFSLAILLPVLVLLITLPRFKKLSQELRNAAERISSDVQKNYISTQEEVKRTTGGIQNEIYAMKVELTNKINQEKDFLQRGISAVNTKLDSKMDKPAEEN